MLEFKYIKKSEYTDSNRKIIIKDMNDETIHDIIDIFIRFLKVIGFCGSTIINGFLSAIDDIKDDIKEDYIMTQDEEEENL